MLVVVVTVVVVVLEVELDVDGVLELELELLLGVDVLWELEPVDDPRAGVEECDCDELDALVPPPATA